MIFKMGLVNEGYGNSSFILYHERRDNEFGLGINMDELNQGEHIELAGTHVGGTMSIVTFTVEPGPEGNLQYSPVTVYLASKCDFDGNFRTIQDLHDTISSIELYNQEDDDGNKYLEFSPLW